MKLKNKFIVGLISPLFLLLLMNTVIAQQPCNDDIIMNTKGSWEKRSDANVYPDNSFPKNQFAQVNSRIDKMQKLLQAAYPDPKGIEAGWYRSISGDALVKGGPVPYELTALFLVYFCNTNINKIEPEDETDTWFYVWANQLNWFAEYVKYYVIQNQPVYLLTPKVGEFNGYPLYKGIHNTSSNTGIKYSRTLIITRNGQSPYVPVTKKQFLKAFLNRNEKRFPKTLAALERNIIVKTDEQEEANKKKQLEKIERTTARDRIAKARDYFLRTYVTEKQQKEEWIAKIKREYEEDMKPAQNLLANSPEEELEQPAILDFTNLLEFKEFSTEEKGGLQLVRLNPDYFDSKLPRYVPQFLIVYWRWYKSKPAENFKNQLEANFNFRALKEMIDK